MIVNAYNNLIELPATIVAKNRQLISPKPPVGLKGNFQTGSVEFFAQTAPSQGFVILTFDAQIASITTRTFASFRADVARLLGADIAAQLDTCSGIDENLPEPGRFMTDYVACLFSSLFGAHFAVDSSDGTAAFNASQSPNQQCGAILRKIHHLATNVLGFSGSLQVQATPGQLNAVRAIIHVTKVEFSDGVIIPFTGYLDPSIRANGTETLDVATEGIAAEVSIDNAIPIAPGNEILFAPADWRNLIKEN